MICVQTVMPADAPEVSRIAVAQFGSESFRQYAQGYLRLRALEAELAQELIVQREQYRPSLVEPPRAVEKANLSSAFAYHRNR